MLYPTQQSMIGSTPAQSAMMMANNKAQMQTNANNLMAGGKRKWRGGAITVPQFHMLYQPQGGPESNPNNLIAANSVISTRSVMNATNDKYATQMGGSRQMGGFRRKRQTRKNTRRNYKNRKSRKSRKSKKSRKY
jgi:hypothetical protein